MTPDHWCLLYAESPRGRASHNLDEPEWVGEAPAQIAQFILGQETTLVWGVMAFVVRVLHALG